MTDDIELPLEHAEVARDAFITQQAEADLREIAENAALRDNTQRVSLSRLYAYCRTGDDALVAESLRSNLTLRRMHKRFLAETALYIFPVARAASHSKIPERAVAGCRIRAVPSRTVPDCHYVIIDAPEHEDGKILHLSICSGDDLCVTTPLPPCRRGATQITLAESDERFLMLADPKSTVFVA